MFDGVHPVKIHGGLPLDEVLVAVVVHAGEEDVITAGIQRRSGPGRRARHHRTATRQWASATFDVASKRARDSRSL